MAVLNNCITRLDGGILELKETTAPSNTADYGKLYVKSSDSNLYFKADGGTEYRLTDLISTVGITIDGGGAAITTGLKGYALIQYSGVISEVTMLADVSGSIVIDIWKDNYASYPPTVADTITASAKPTISSAIKSQDTTLTGWTTALSAGDILAFNVDSATTITKCSLYLKVLRTI